MGADENAVCVELVQVSADGVDGDVEALRELRDCHLPHLSDVRGEIGLASGGKAARRSV
jgi:hypothetical protein